MTSEYVLFFSMTSVWPLKYKLVSLLCWLKQAECRVHFTIKNKQTEHTKNSTYQQQRNGSKCSLLGMKMTTAAIIVEFRFYPLYVC